MNATFQVGDLVIMQHAIAFDEYNGFPAVVIENARVRRIMNTVTMKFVSVYCYKVKVLKDPDEPQVDRLEYSAMPRQLRKLHDSESEMATDSVSILALTE